MKCNLQQKRIMITGGYGFLGRYIIQKLKERGCTNTFIPKHKDYDLVQIGAVRKVFNDAKPHIVIHLAGKVGGIGFNARKPAELFYDNLMMGAQLMEEARKRGVEKFVALGTVCCYPKFAHLPFKEESLWDGYPEETNAPYALAKKMLLVQSQAYRKQYGFNSIFLMPVNLYGPGDNFNPDSSHVVPALIKKCFDAIKNGEDKIVVWGTGKATREFLYVEDAAEGILMATEKYNNPEPVNLGTGFDISIKDLTDLIAELTGFKGKIEWDNTKPDGQPRRMLDVRKAFQEFRFKPKTKLEEGLKKTIVWYKDINCKK